MISESLENTGAGVEVAPARSTATQTLARWLGRIVVAIFAIGMVIFVLLPFYWMLKSSFQTNSEIIAVPPIWIPRDFTLEGYQRALTMIPFGRYLANSMIIATATTVFSALLASSAAYVLARYAFPGATVILAIFLFTQLIPAITRIFPVYFLIKNLDLINTYPGAIIAYVSFSLPYAVLMLSGYFRNSYPVELEDAALIDGCTLFSVFWRIVLPISLPGIVAIATFTFLGAWNDFLWASLLLYQGQMKTLQVGLRDFIGEMGSLQRANAFMAACVMATIPALILFSIGQKNMVQGISAGAVKG